MTKKKKAGCKHSTASQRYLCTPYYLSCVRETTPLARRHSVHCADYIHTLCTTITRTFKMAQQQQQQRRRTGNSQKQAYQTLLADGFSLYRADDQPTAASEKLLQAVYAAPSVWAKHRYCAFALASSTCKGVLCAGIQNFDIELIKKLKKDFVYNENEPAHFRGEAASWVAFFYSTIVSPNFNLNTAAELLRYGQDIIAASPQQDENRQVLNHPYTPFWEGLRITDLSLKGALYRLGECTEELLATFTNSPAVSANQSTARLHERVLAGGKLCDCCGKTPEQLHITLKKCSRCHLVYYCSEACQREHWKKQGHQRGCRKKGQIEIGDDLQLLTKDDNLTTFVKVIARIKDSTTNRWQVQRYINGEGFTGERKNVDGADLLRLRPPSTL